MTHLGIESFGPMGGSQLGILPNYAEGSLPLAGNPGSLARVTTGARGLWMDQGSQWFSLTRGIFNVKEFGAKGDGTTDDTAAIQGAIDAATAAGGGIVFLPYGTYLVSSTLNLTNSGYPIWLAGSGTRTTKIKTTVSNTSGINASSANSRFNRISDLALYKGTGSLPVVAAAGNYGIRNTAAVGYQLVIDNVEVMGFADSGIFIEGATGPVIIRDCSIQNIAGYGVEVAVESGNAPQNVNIEGGNIQESWGGIFIEQAFGLQASNVDVELGDKAVYPALYINGAAYGNTFTNVTFSIGAIPTPAAVVCIDGGASGATFVGGINYSTVVADNYRLNSCSRTTIVAGEYVNKGAASSGYFMSFGGGTHVTVINPVLTATYQAGRNLVNDVAANFVTAIGVATAAGTGSSGDTVVVPATIHTANLTALVNILLTNFLQLTEMTAPGVGAANTARIFAVDNGGGKTVLKVQFASGSAQVIATEP